MSLAFSTIERRGCETGKRIVLSTLCSVGDLHPYIAIGRGLQARGHDVIIATSECYRHKIEALGLGFRPVRPDSDWMSDPKTMERMMDFRMGTVRIIREMLLPSLRESYEDVLAATEGADLLVSHPLAYADRLVSEKTGIPWVSTMITPYGFFSAYDLPVFFPAPVLSKRLRFLGPSFWCPVRTINLRAVRFWAKPWYRLREEIGLPRTSELNPLVSGHSPLMHLALFSKQLGNKQPDWPQHSVITGFPMFDEDRSAELPAALTRFLNDGPPPIVFTLSVSAATVGGRFFEHSVAAAKLLGRRAVIITGKNTDHRLPELPEGIVAFEYAPFSKLFEHADVIVHAGGVGTAGLAMRSGRPMIVVPFGHDQPDNADRLARMGVSRTIPPHRYTPTRAAAELQCLFDNPSYFERAEEVGEHVRHENGVRTACDAMEHLLQSAPRIAMSSRNTNAASSRGRRVPQL